MYSKIRKYLLSFNSAANAILIYNTNISTNINLEQKTNINKVFV